MNGKAKSVPLPEMEKEKEKGTVQIGMRASIVGEADGVVTLAFDTTSLKDQDYAVLQRLFPNVIDRAFKLLEIETLLASIV